MGEAPMPRSIHICYRLHRAPLRPRPRPPHSRSQQTRRPLPPPPITVQGNIEELTSHYYKFAAHKGRALSVDVIANRIGSKLDPLVRLLDSSGKELLLCDDDPAIAPESRFSYLIPSNGD